MPGTRADTSSSAERWPTVNSKRVNAIIELSWPTVRALAIGADDDPVTVAAGGHPRTDDGFGLATRIARHEGRVAVGGVDQVAAGIKETVQDLPGGLDHPAVAPYLVTVTMTGLHEGNPLLPIRICRLHQSVGLVGGSAGSGG